jgi:hypothetical protein
MTDFEVVEINREPVPEPTTLLLLGSGPAGLAGVRRQKILICRVPINNQEKVKSQSKRQFQKK